MWGVKGIERSGHFRETSAIQVALKEKIFQEIIRGNLSNLDVLNFNFLKPPRHEYIDKQRFQLGKGCRYKMSCLEFA